MSTVLFEIKDGVAWITLNRPASYNSFNREMSLALQERLDECKGKEIRAVYLTGAGKAFSSGQDLEEVPVHVPAGVDRTGERGLVVVAAERHETAGPVVGVRQVVQGGAERPVVIRLGFATE